MDHLDFRMAAGTGVLNEQRLLAASKHTRRVLERSLPNPNSTVRGKGGSATRSRRGPGGRLMHAASRAESARRLGATPKCFLARNSVLRTELERPPTHHVCSCATSVCTERLIPPSTDGFHGPQSTWRGVGAAGGWPNPGRNSRHRTRRRGNHPAAGDDAGHSRRCPATPVRALARTRSTTRSDGASGCGPSRERLLVAPTHVPDGLWTAYSRAFAAAERQTDATGSPDAVHWVCPVAASPTCGT